MLQYSTETITTQDLRRIWNSGEEHTRRAYVAELLAIYDHDWLELLVDRLRLNFEEQNFEKIRHKADISINILASAVNELAKIYSVPAVRSLDGEAEPLDPYLMGGDLDDALDEAARLCFLCKEVFIRPIVVGDLDPYLVLDVVTPDKVCAIPHPQDPLKMLGIAVQLPAGRWSIWTSEEHWVVDSQWNPIPFRLDPSDPKSAVERVVNPYGMIPYVVCRGSYPTRHFWHHRQINGLLEATYTIAIGKTDHTYLRHMQSHKQLVIHSDDDTEKVTRMTMDAMSAIHVRGSSAGASVLDMQANLREHLDTLLQAGDAVLSGEGIRAETTRGQLDASSGYALTIKEHKQAQRLESYRRSWARNERELLDVVRSVWAEDAGGIIPDGSLEIQFGALGPGQNPLEKAELAKRYLDLGFSEDRIFSEVLGKSADWIEKNKATREEERINRLALAPISSPPTLQGEDDGGISA